jgi:hypothetical protein
MSSTSWLFTHDTETRRTAGDLVNTHSERLAAEELARAEQRRWGLAEQRSELNSPEVRIRAWEKLHGLRLPSDPGHNSLEVIASGTGLTLAEVRGEQTARKANAAGKKTADVQAAPQL